MPQPVPRLSKASALVPSKSPAVKPSSGDQGAFSDELDRAGARKSSPASTNGKKPAQTDSKKATPADKSAKRAGQSNVAAKQEKQQSANGQAVPRPAADSGDADQPPPDNSRRKDQSPRDEPAPNETSTQAEPQPIEAAAIVQIANPPKPAPVPDDRAAEPKPPQPVVAATRRRTSTDSSVKVVKSDEKPTAPDESQIGDQTAANSTEPPKEPQAAHAPSQPDAAPPAKKTDPQPAKRGAQTKQPQATADSDEASSAVGGAVLVSTDSGEASSDSAPKAVAPADLPDSPALGAAQGAENPGAKMSAPLTSAAAPPATAGSQHGAPAEKAAQPLLPQVQFTDTNHPKIVTAIQAQLLPDGGSMRLRLDPPELGALHIRVEMRQGVMTASFETSTDQATRLLSHSLSDLKTVLEAQGVSVGRLHVQQSSRQAAPEDDGRRTQRDSQQTSQQQEQQRREMLRRMWRRLTNGQDPLDLVA